MLDIFWIIFCTTLVLLMQAGFLSLEIGFSRSKNMLNVAMKNMADIILTIVLFWAVGFMIMFGPSIDGWLAFSDPVIDAALNDRLAAILIFEALFCGTATTIVSGAVAERLRFPAYLIVAALMAVFLFPLMGHWVWNSQVSATSQGWLERLGFIDWAGGTVVHSLGGWVSLALILVVGPRLNRFAGGIDRIDGYTIRNLPFAMLGAFILFIGWIGFNGGATLRFDTSISAIVANTIIAGAAGGVAGSLFYWFRTGSPGVLACISGLLSGLVSITAGAHAVTPFSAVIIGALGGIAAVVAFEVLEKLKIDDVVGAVPVHLVGGIWGTLAVAIFANAEHLKADDRLAQLGVQLLGIGVCFVLGFVVVYPLLRGLNSLYPLRVSRADEERGLSVSEHGTLSELDQLVEVMAKQSETGDLSKRAAQNDFTELGMVGNYYNKLVEKQETLTNNLESHVAQRTSQLESANSELQFEIEQRIKAQTALSLAKEEAELANWTKSTFLANMSHELRTPLNSIIGFSDILNSQMYGELPDPRYLDYVKCINDSGQHLLAIINDILDLSKIENGKLELHEEYLSVREMVESCFKIVSQEAIHRGLDLTSDIPDDMPMLLADELRIRQILLNLLSNAIKFTPERGQVLIKAVKSRQTGIILSVSDTGIGIPEADFEKVLKPFGQSDDIMTRQKEGTGLGLSISKSLIELHHGSLRLESVVGEGTTVSIEFPVERVLKDE
jgi:Amt family ammonium transporter